MNSKKSSSSSSARTAGGVRPALLLAGLLITAAVLALGSLASLWTAPPPSKDEPAENAATFDAPDSGRHTSSWSFWSDETPETGEEGKPRKYSAEIWDHVSKFETPTVQEVIERLHALGDYSGIGAFNPPGTRPPLIGIAVPEDFVLPEGFVRHHQVTDDGQRIEAVLMFAPDYDHRDAYNQPIAVPENRVVPPELAPRGLPRRQVVVPKPIQNPEYEL